MILPFLLTIALFGLQAIRVVFFTMFTVLSEYTALVLFIYVAFWVLEYYEVMDNPADTFLITVYSWLQTLVLLDLPGLPIRFTIEVISKFKENVWDMSKKAQVVIFVMLAYPFIYQSLNLISVGLQFVAIPAAAMYVLDPGLLIDPKSGEIRNGFPSLLAELMGIYKILYFNFEYLQDDWEPSMNVHELFKLRWITYF